MTARCTTPSTRADLASSGYTGVTLVTTMTACTLPPTLILCGAGGSAPGATIWMVTPSVPGWIRVLRCSSKSLTTWVILWRLSADETSPSCTGSLESSSLPACSESPTMVMLLMGCGPAQPATACRAWAINACWAAGGGGVGEPAGTEPRVPRTTPPVTPPDTPLPTPPDTVTDWVATGCASGVLGNSKLIWTTRVVPAESLVKCHCKTDCNAALRSSSGPLSTCASATLPLASSLTSTDKVPWMPARRAATGYSTGERCSREAPLNPTVTPGESLTTWGAAISGNVPVTSQQAAINTATLAMRAEIKRVLDIRASVRMRMTLCFR